MIVQTKRPKGYGAVLKGADLKISREAEHIVLTTWGVKGQTGEPYEFRVLLTQNEAATVVDAVVAA